jgi:predicted dienelactone hydrolase
MSIRKRAQLYPAVSALFISLALVHLAHAQVGLRETDFSHIHTTLVYPTSESKQQIVQGPFEIEAAINAPAPLKKHALVVISHGTGGSAIADHALASALALGGFVVAQPLHPGDNYLDSKDSGPISFERRPHDILRIINALEADPYWAPRINFDRIGVHGMSAGGVTALSLAGGQWSMLHLIRHCNKNMEADLGFCFAGAKEGAAYDNRKLNFESAQGVPDDHLPDSLKTLHGGQSPNPSQLDTRLDSRIAAITLAAPVAAIFDANSLQNIKIPVGVVSAENDTLLVPQFHSEYVLQHVATAKSLTRLQAGHFDVLWPWPEAVAKMVASQFLRGGETTPNFDPLSRVKAHEKIVAFYQQMLKP